MWVCGNSIDIGSLLCTRTCNGTRSVRYNSWFYKSKLRVVEILLFTYFWWYKVPLSQIQREYGFSSRTLVDWASFCREVAIDVVFNHSEPIGGLGIVVEIDESKFGKSMKDVYYEFINLLIIFFIFREISQGKKS